MRARLSGWPAQCLCALLLAVPGSGEQARKVMDEGARFAACPDSPNCLSSLSEDPDHYTEPLRYEGRPEAARERLVALLRRLPRVRLVTDEPRYLHAELTSAVFRFVDDVEFRVDDGVIQVRSASRLGYYDFGANRRRLEKIRRLLAEGAEER